MTVGVGLLLIVILGGLIYATYSGTTLSNNRLLDFVMRHRKFLLVLVWCSALCIWGVSKITQTIQERPVPAVNVPSSTIVQNPSQYAVTVNQNTVWVIDLAQNEINVITHDKDGYHEKLVNIENTP